MYEPLADAPLVEAICDFRFEPSDQWDWTVPGRLYDKISEEFPHREQVQGFGFSLQVGDSPQTPLPSVQGGLDRVLMRRGDGSALVQSGPHQLIVNQLAPYPGWKEFETLVDRLLTTYLQLAPSEFQRVGLRYINQIPASAEIPWKIGSVITLDPPIPKQIDRPLANFYQRYELQHDDPPGVLVHQTGMQMTQENEAALLLDLDFGSLPSGLSNTSDAKSWLGAAHDRIEEAFRASIAPDLLSRMKRGG